MTQTYREDGTIVPVTVVQVDRCVVTQIKSTDKDGYAAVQLGFGKRKHAGKTMRGHLKSFSAKNMPAFLRLREVRLSDASPFTVGDAIDVTMFQPGDKISATGTSKGKGFQGVVKRHHFHGHPSSHGHKDQMRMPGSIGAGEPQHVFKGTRMAGRMGGDRVTVKNLEVVSVDAEKHLLYVKGALPGARNSLIILMGEGDGVIAANLFVAPVVEEKPVADVQKEPQPEQAVTGSETKSEAPVQEVKAETVSESTPQTAEPSKE